MHLRGKWLVGALAAGALSLAPASASAAVFDLTGGGTVTINGAIFSTNDQDPTGSGVIQSFVRISGNTDVVDGHNTSGRPVLNDENTSPTFTRDLQLSAVPIVNLGGTNYYEFFLDINQTNADPNLSLNAIQICLDTAGGLTAANTCPSGPPNYDLDGAGDNSLILNYSLNSGSGSGDLFMYVPVSALGNVGSNFVYLYSSFGDATNNNNDGFEEWAVRTPSTPPDGETVPEPATLALFGLAMLAGGVRMRARRA